VSEEDRSLVDFVSSVAGETFLKVEEHLGNGFVRLKTSEAERRQAKHDIQSVEDVVVELLRNARDAESRNVFLAFGREGDERRLAAIDDGCGIPSPMHALIFEPRVTSKLDTMVMDRYGVHGRGMALFSIRSNVAAAQVVASGSGVGTAVRVVADTRVLSERKDQSTWPAVLAEDEGEESERLKGPRNIIRMACEFALDSPGVRLWAGSPAEVAATMYALAHQDLGAQIVRVGDESRLPLWQRLSLAEGAVDLVRRAATLGLELSERNAHRVIGGEVRPLVQVRDQIRRGRPVALQDAQAASAGEGSVDLTLDRRSVKPTAADLIALQARLAGAFDEFAKRYYLELKDLPKVTVGRKEITVRFHIDKD
jgi:hypothetical protein